MDLSKLTFEKLAEEEDASSKWAGIAEATFTKEAFLGTYGRMLTGAHKTRAAGELARLGGETARADAALVKAVAEGGKPAEALRKATVKLKGKEVALKSKGWVQRLGERVKSPVGKGEYAGIRKQKAVIESLKARKGPGSAIAARTAERDAARAAEELGSAGVVRAGEQVGTARTLTGVGLVGAGTVAAASGGRRRRGPVIVA